MVAPAVEGLRVASLKELPEHDTRYFPAERSAAARSTAEVAFSNRIQIYCFRRPTTVASEKIEKMLPLQLAKLGMRRDINCHDLRKTMLRTLSS